MALNLRSIEPELHAELKAAAARAQQSLDAFCIGLLAGAMSGDGERQTRDRVVSGRPNAKGSDVPVSNPAPPPNKLRKQLDASLAVIPAAPPVDTRAAYYVPAKYRDKKQ